MARSTSGSSSTVQITGLGIRSYLVVAPQKQWDSDSNPRKRGQDRIEIHLSFIRRTVEEKGRCAVNPHTRAGANIFLNARNMSATRHLADEPLGIESKRGRILSQILIFKRSL